MTVRTVLVSSSLLIPSCIAPSILYSIEPLFAAYPSLANFFENLSYRIKANSKVRLKLKSFQYENSITDAAMISSNELSSWISRKRSFVLSMTPELICSSLKACSRICQSLQWNRRGSLNIKLQRITLPLVSMHSFRLYVDAVAAAVNALFKGSDFCPYKHGYRKNDDGK